MKNFIFSCFLSAFVIISCQQTVWADKSPQPMPNCALLLANQSANIQLKEHLGKVLYVDFWASWCGPCVKSFAFLNQLNDEFKPQGLDIIGVNLDENFSEAQAFLDKYPANFTIATDQTQQCATEFHVKAMPSSYLIDKKGNIRHVHLGFRADEASKINALIRQLLAE
ncbi:MAG: TlpA family protein disulfide reductase [Methylovulum sp.]|jgi:thiol-disulfide isomerase/thioredoxin|nr:TlpA family protein disulfide reductase [Methylovulum sp.]